MLTYMLSDTDLATAHMHIRPEYKGALNKGASFGKCISNKQQFIHMTGHLYGSLPTKSYASAVSLFAYYWGVVKISNHEH